MGHEGPCSPGGRTERLPGPLDPQAWPGAGVLITALLSVLWQECLSARWTCGWGREGVGQWWQSELAYSVSRGLT